MRVHQTVRRIRIATGYCLGYCLVLGENGFKAGGFALDRCTMEAHSDRDVVLQGFHCSAEIAVLRGASDRQMKLEIRVLAVRLTASGVTHQLQRCADRRKLDLIMAPCCCRSRRR